MKTYASIPHYNKGLFGEYCYAFDKLDGNNIRLEWNKKRGWYKFGTRNVIIDSKNPDFGDSINIFMNKYSEDLQKIFRDKKEYRNCDNFVVFCEYVGENSFAGKHDPNDILDMILFDVSQYKRGIIPPKEFLENFSILDIPKLIYQGEYNMELIQLIRNNDFSLKEGVICKGTYKTKGNDIVWMSKIKTNEWLYKIKSTLGEKELLLELNGDMSLLN